MKLQREFVFDALPLYNNLFIIYLTKKKKKNIQKKKET